MTDGPRHSARRPAEEYAYLFLAIAAAALLAVGTVVYRLIEDWSWVDSFYFSAIAVTTVGFGDLAPTSSGAKIFTAFYVLSGIAVITSFLNVRLKRHARHIASARHEASTSAESSDPDG